MKRIIILLSLVLFTSCYDGGTMEKIETPNELNIEVFKYYVSDTKYIYISKFKDSNVTTTTWEETEGKNHEVKSNITLPDTIK